MPLRIYGTWAIRQAEQRMSLAKNPTHTYISTGPFNVKLQVTSGAGCVHDTMIVLNTVHPQPKADFKADKAGICIGEQITFTDISNGLDGIINQWH